MFSHFSKVLRNNKVFLYCFQAAETQSLLHSLQEELQEQKQKNSDLVELNQKECDLEQHVSLNVTEEVFFVFVCLFFMCQFSIVKVLTVKLFHLNR